MVPAVIASGVSASVRMSRMCQDCTAPYRWKTIVVPSGAQRGCVATRDARTRPDVVTTYIVGDRALSGLPGSSRPPQYVPVSRRVLAIARRAPEGYRPFGHIPLPERAPARSQRARQGTRVYSVCAQPP